MIISLVKDDPKQNPSGKGQFSPRYSLKGNPSSIWSSSNLPHSRKEQPLSPPRSGTCVHHAKNLLQSRLPGPVRWEEPSKVGGRSSMFQMCPYIHLSKMKNSVTKFCASMLPGWWGTPENELTLCLHAYSIMANAVGSPAHLRLWHLFVHRGPAGDSQWLASLVTPIFIGLSQIFCFISTIFVMSTVPSGLFNVGHKFSSKST